MSIAEDLIMRSFLKGVKKLFTRIKRLFIILMLSQSTLYAQDDFSLNYNPFNSEVIDSTGYWVAEDSYMDVPSIFLTYNDSTQNYVIFEGLVIYQEYYNRDCEEDVYWDILEFKTGCYEYFPDCIQILGFRIITEIHYTETFIFENEN